MRITLKHLVMTLGTVGAMVLGGILALDSCGLGLVPKVLAAETQGVVAEIKEESSDTFSEIQKNIDRVELLRSKVQSTQSRGEQPPLDSTIKDIEEITKSYEHLASKRAAIKRTFMGKVVRVEKMQLEIDTEIKTLTERKRAYTEQLEGIRDPNPEVTRARKAALTKAIGYVDQQVQLWEAFRNTERDITKEMLDIQSKLDSFLSMIESTSIVFREGLNLLYLQRDINEAVALFANDLPRLEQLTTDMEKSWGNLDYLLESLTGIANLELSDGK